MKILPASAERMANEIGGEILDRYNKIGLTTYRTYFEDEDEVEEGYLDTEGNKVPYKVITKEEATQR